ncbi:MAG: hypothetical protein V5788_02730 [Shewanella sp.]
MDSTDILMLGLGLQAPWNLVGQNLDTGKSPHELHLQVAAERGSLYPCLRYRSLHALQV